MQWEAYPFTLGMTSAVGMETPACSHEEHGMDFACPVSYSPWEGAPGCSPASVCPKSPSILFTSGCPITVQASSGSSSCPETPAAPSRGGWGTGGAHAQSDTGRACAIVTSRASVRPRRRHGGTGSFLPSNSQGLCSLASISPTVPAPSVTAQRPRSLSHHCSQCPGFPGCSIPSARHAKVCPSASIALSMPLLTARSSHAAAWHGTSTLLMAMVSA